MENIWNLICGFSIGLMIVTIWKATARIKTLEGECRYIRWVMKHEEESKVVTLEITLTTDNAKGLRDKISEISKEIRECSQVTDYTLKVKILPPTYPYS